MLGVHDPFVESETHVHSETGVAGFGFLSQASLWVAIAIEAAVIELMPRVSRHPKGTWFMVPSRRPDLLRSLTGSPPASEDTK